MSPAYIIKEEVKNTGKPVMHRDGTWYVCTDKGIMRKLIKMGSTFLYKNGDVFTKVG